MPRYSIWQDLGDEIGRTYRISTTVQITGLGTLTFTSAASQDDVNRITEAFREALIHVGDYPVAYVAKEDILSEFNVNDYGFVTDNMARDVAEKIGDNDAFQTTFWETLKAAVEDSASLDDVRTAIAEAKLWYKHELKLGTHVVAKQDITAEMLYGLADNSWTIQKADSLVLIEKGTEGVIVCIGNFEEDGVEVEWHSDSGFDYNWNVNPEWLDNDE